MRNSIKKAISAILCLVLLLSFSSFAFAKTEAEPLQFNKDGRFTILNLSDIQDFYPMYSITRQLIKALLKEVKPDLVVLTGDNVAGYSAQTKALAKAEIKEIMDIFEKANCKVAIVFGNHDDDRTTATKEFEMDVYESYSCFAGCAGEELSGCGTYNIPLLSSDGSHYAFNLWFTDSGTYNDENDLGGYGCPHKDQIDWYISKSNSLKAQNGGKAVPSINFQHIVVPEIYDALKIVEPGTAGALERDGKYYALPDGAKGVMHEMPSPPNYTNGQFDAFVKQGDVLATVCGHDHVNTYEVMHKGINIINTPGVGFCSYDDETVGARVFVLDENAPENYETYCVFYTELFKDNEAMMYKFRAFSETSTAFERVFSWFRYIAESIKNLFMFPFVAK